MRCSANGAKWLTLHIRYDKYCTNTHTHTRAFLSTYINSIYCKFDHLAHTSADLFLCLTLCPLQPHIHVIVPYTFIHSFVRSLHNSYARKRRKESVLHTLRSTHHTLVHFLSGVAAIILGYLQIIPAFSQPSAPPLSCFHPLQQYSESHMLHK